MQENGIYNKWQDSYLNKWKVNESEEDVKILCFEIAYLKHFKSLLVICTGKIVLSSIAFVQELFNKNKKKTSEAKTKNFVHGSYQEIISLDQQFMTEINSRHSGKRRIQSAPLNNSSHVY